MSRIKSVDTNFTSFQGILGITESFVALNLCVNGTSFWNRTGNKICMDSVEVSVQFQPNNTNGAAVSMDYARFLLVYDENPNGALPSWADIITSYDQGGNASSTALDRFNVNNEDRFTILMDRKLRLPALGINGITGTNSNIEPTWDELKLTHSLDLRCLPSIYKSNLGTIADLSTGSLFWACKTQVIATANSGWDYFGTSRLEFTD